MADEVQEPQEVEVGAWWLDKDRNRLGPASEPRPLGTWAIEILDVGPNGEQTEVFATV